MSESELESLRRRVQDLQFQLDQRESDLETYRSELVKTNSELQRLIAEISGQLQIAARIQRLLTPTEYPTISGFEFSSKFVAGSRFGGDYFDIYEFTDRLRFGLLLSSGSGYSVSSHLLSVLLGLAGQKEFRSGADFRVIYNKLIGQLVPLISDADSLSLFLGIVDKRSYELEYVMHGPLVGLHYTHDEQKIKELKRTNHPVTSTHDISQGFKAETVALNPSDRLVLCSDGVSDVRNSENTPFGESRVYKAVLGAQKNSVHDIRNEIFYRLERFRGQSEFDKDLTVLVAEVKDRVIKLAPGSN